MKYSGGPVWALAFLLGLCLILAGCGGPLAKADADRASESTWAIKKKPLMGGGVRETKVDLVTKGPKFKAVVNSKYNDPRMGEITENYTVLSDGVHMWRVDRSEDGEESGGALQWKIDPDLVRSKLFWKSESLAPAATEVGSEDIDGKSYKKFEAQMGNALGGTTIYTYYLDESNSSYRRLTKQLKDDSHVDVYDCVKYNGSTAAPDSDFVYQGEAETVLNLDILE